MTSAYYPGQSVRLTNGVTPSKAAAPFADTTGTPVDPTLVTVTVVKPDRSSLTPPVTKDGTGLYHSDVIVDEPGRWYYKMAGTGAVTAVQWGYFEVIAPPFS